MSESGWIEIDAYCEKYGERKNTVHKRVNDGTWPRGEFYSSPSGRTGYVHEARAREWLIKNDRMGDNHA